MTDDTLREFVTRGASAQAAIDALGAGPMSYGIKYLTDAVDQLKRERDEARAEIERLRAALERVEGMAERPVCVCGRPTGTAAIKQAARTALTRDP